MATSNRLNLQFSINDFYQKSSEYFSEDQIINLIVKNFNTERRNLALRQLKIYLKKLTSQPSMRPVYITNIKELIQFEKKMVKSV